jgi:hypothetical protein
VRYFRQFAVVFAVLYSSSIFATPEKISVFFLSEQLAASLIEYIDSKEQPRMTALTAESNFECIPMGDGCFHPQLGYQEKKPVTLKKLPDTVESDSLELKTFNSDSVNLVECREGEYFDIFCGRAKKQIEGRANDLEVWFDVSASMRKVDYSRDLQYCHRRSFAQRLEQVCSKKPVFAVFNTSLKEIMDFSQICVPVGANSQTRMIDWIRASRAKHLILITDIEEYSGAFRDFLSAENSTIYGIDEGNFGVEKLMQMTDNLKESCKN